MAPQTKEARKAASQAAYHKLKARLYAAKGDKCRDCPASSLLQIHHVATDGKNHVRRGSRYKEYRRLLENPDQYELLCGPCHQVETMKYVRSFRTPFGTPARKRASISEGPNRASL